MKKICRPAFFILLMFGGSIFAANLPPYTNLNPGQSIFSDNGQYQLIMQNDGNLVYYRLSGMTPRFNSQTHGNPGAWTQMQGDGNLVTYTSGGRALWYTGTSNSPGAYVAVQDDGNLVVYNNGQALWNIGVDPLNDNPSLPGDVVGRDLANFVGPLGHIGFWDGGHVVEVLNQPTVVQYNSLSTFKTATAYWGVAAPNIPNYYVYGCYLDYCSNNGYQTVASRIGMFYRAYQIAMLGAEYTLTTAVRRAAPKYASPGGNVPYVKGMYRCDTFVLDVYASNGAVTSNGSSQVFTAQQQNWFHFEAGPLRTPLLPATVFSKLKSYTG